MDKEKTKGQFAGEATADWWAHLRPAPERNHKGDRAALAQLRRMQTVPEALTAPRTMDLIQRIAGATGWRVSPTANWITPAAVCAITLAHLRKNGSRPMAEALGQGPMDTPRYSGLRFTRLIRADSDEERLTQLGRAARRLRADEAAVNISRFATDIFRLWLSPDDVRRDWTFQYHQMTAAAPDTGSESKNEVSQ